MIVFLIEIVVPSVFSIVSSLFLTFVLLLFLFNLTKQTKIILDAKIKNDLLIHFEDRKMKKSKNVDITHILDFKFSLSSFRNASSVDDDCARKLEYQSYPLAHLVELDFEKTELFSVHVASLPPISYSYYQILK